MIRINRLFQNMCGKLEKVELRKDKEAFVWCANGMERG